jgi:hypothetical protein
MGYYDKTLYFIVNTLIYNWQNQIIIIISTDV